MQYDYVLHKKSYEYVLRVAIFIYFCLLVLHFYFLSDIKSNDVVPWVLSLILSKYIPSQNPHVRQAACIWLLSLVKKLSQHKEITVRTPYCSKEDQINHVNPFTIVLLQIKCIVLC